MTRESILLSSNDKWPFGGVCVCFLLGSLCVIYLKRTPDPRRGRGYCSVAEHLPDRQRIPDSVPDISSGKRSSSSWYENLYLGDLLPVSVEDFDLCGPMVKIQYKAA